MVTKTINVYSYDELCENAKDRIREKWRLYDLMDCYNSDYEATLEEFGKICNAKVKDWEVGLHGSYFRFDCEGYPYEICDKDGYVDEYVALESLSGKLLFRYVLNNIIPYIVERKVYWKNWPKKRTSRIIYNCHPEQGTCPLTGYYADCDIIEPIMKYYRAWTSYPADYTYEDLMNECLSAFFDVWEKDYEYQYSDEAIDEYIEANWSDRLYFSDGTVYDGELDEVA